MPVLNSISAMEEELTAWRKDFHAHPELGYHEKRTAGLVAERLRAFGVDRVIEGVARTGVVGVIEGARPGDRTIGLRADMDALPIAEATGAPHASTHPGKMHACGHDGHTTILLGAAKHLAETRNFAGKVVLLFQPAEEGGGGGAKMVEEGVMDRFGVDEVYGLHNMPSAPFGVFAIRSGPAMAAADVFEIELVGSGCHAAMPHVGRDPIPAAAALIQALQAMTARETDPLDQRVVSVTKMTAGETHNVTPERARLAGTVRTFRPETRDSSERRIGEIVRAIGEAYGVRGELRYNRGYPATVNHPRETEHAANAAAAVVGEDKVDRDAEPMMGAEDFSYMLEARPGAYVFLGIGGAEEGRVLHSPIYDFDDRVSPIGVSFFARLVEDRLAG